MPTRIYKPSARMLAAALALLLAGYAVAQDSTWTPSGKELPASELAALHSFRAHIEQHRGLLSTWSNDTHPCSWEGVLCECSDVYPRRHQDCPDEADPEFEHVFGLDFGPRKPSNKWLTGTLSPLLGDLSEARILYFHSNELRGTIPSTLSRPQKLQRLIFRENQLTGTLPPELGNGSFTDIYFDDNSLTGPIPDAWCGLLSSEGGHLNVLHPGGNSHLCGRLPDCFHEASQVATQHLAGTCLQVADIPSRAGEDPRSYPGGMCDSTPPYCHADACIMVPRVVSNLTHFDFSHPPFHDDESGITEYRYYVGTLEHPSVAMSAKAHSANDIGANNLYHDSFIAPGIALQNGGRYYVTLEAVNGACPALVHTVVSTAIRVDSTPPRPPASPDGDSRTPVFGNMQCSFAVTEQLLDEPLHACWEPFIDPESSITHYTVAVMRQPLGRDLEMAIQHTTETISCDSGKCRASAFLTLAPGDDVYFVIRAYNEAGDTLDWPSSHMRVAEPPQTSKLVAVVVASVLSVVAVLTAIVLGFTYAWKQRKAKYRKKIALRILYENLQAMLATTVANLTSEDLKEELPNTDIEDESVLNIPSVYFVFTDIEESTQMAATDPKACAGVQEIHDGVMRKHIAATGGYEVMTQGDAFEVAFASAEAAITFCLGVQADLLSMDWSSEVLALPSCGREAGATGWPLFAGPRIRMGIHYGEEGAFERHLNPMTQRVQFRGLAYMLAEEIGDAGHGGQIVMSGPAYDAAMCARKGRSLFKLCLFNHIGCFKMNKWPEVLPMFEVLPPLASRMERRVFPNGLRRSCKSRNSPKLGLYVPNPGRPALPQAGFEGLVAARPQLGTDLNILHDTLGAVCQLFEGHLVAGDAGEAGCLLYVLPDAVAAARFCLTAQVALMRSAAWPKTSPGSSQSTVAGLPLFKGPRVGMVAHSCPGLAITELVVRQEGCHQPLYTVAGQGVHEAAAVLAATHPGQVVLTTEAWHKFQAVSHMGVKVLSLGTHVLSGCSEPMALLEAMPAALADRQFPATPSLKYIGLSYRDAPAANTPMAIMFIKAPSMPEDADEAALAAHREAIKFYCAKVRSMAVQFRGYECKEAHGKFMMCFTALDRALALAVNLQAALLKSIWPEALLGIEAFSRKFDNQGRLLSAGLAPAIGIAWGTPTSKKPSASSGRADYFGPLCNLAARCMASAAYGQVVVDGQHLRAQLGEDFPEVPLLRKPNRRSSFSLGMEKLNKSIGNLKALQASAPKKSSAASSAPGDPLHDGSGRRVYPWQLEEADREMKWKRELTGLPHTEGSVRLQGMGLYHLKGFPDPACLVLAWLPALDASHNTAKLCATRVVEDSRATTRAPASDGGNQMQMSRLKRVRHTLPAMELPGSVVADEQAESAPPDVRNIVQLRSKRHTQPPAEQLAKLRKELARSGFDIGEQRTTSGFDIAEQRAKTVFEISEASGLLATEGRRVTLPPLGAQLAES